MEGENLMRDKAEYVREEKGYLITEPRTDPETGLVTVWGKSLPVEGLTHQEEFLYRHDTDPKSGIERWISKPSDTISRASYSLALKQRNIHEHIDDSLGNLEISYDLKEDALETSLISSFFTRYDRRSGILQEFGFNFIPKIHQTEDGPIRGIAVKARFKLKDAESKEFELAINDSPLVLDKFILDDDTKIGRQYRYERHGIQMEIIDEKVVKISITDIMTEGAKEEYEFPFTADINMYYQAIESLDVSRWQEALDKLVIKRIDSL